MPTRAQLAFGENADDLTGLKQLYGSLDSSSIRFASLDWKSLKPANDGGENGHRKQLTLRHEEDMSAQGPLHSDGIKIADMVGEDQNTAATRHSGSID